MEPDDAQPSRIVTGNLVTLSAAPGRGIGIVTRVEATLVEVRFEDPAGGTTAITVASDDVVPHRFPATTTIFSRGEQAYGSIKRHRVTDGVVTYTVQFGTRTLRIPEHDIVLHPRPTDPFDVLADGDIGAAVPFILAYQARRLLFAYSYDELVSLSNARIDLLPHQVFVAHRVIAEYPKGFLLADEVGLGKTIEAGLIIKELRARRLADRVLVIAPAGLVPQWVNELRSKFNDRFVRLDSTTYSAYAAEHGPEHVWQAFDNIVTSLHFLRGNDDHIAALAAQHWDVLIFDEAHHLRRVLEGRGGDERRSTQAYQLAYRLRDTAHLLLFLTATPLQLHAYELYSLIELLDPALFPTYAAFERYRARIPQLNAVVRDLEQYDQLSPGRRQTLAQEVRGLLAASSAPEAQPSARSTDEVVALLEGSATDREQVAQAIADLHTLTSVMLRNRKRVVFDDLQPRKAIILQVQFSPVERTAYDAVTAYIDRTYNLAIARSDLALGFVMVTYRKILTSSSYALSQSFKRRIARLEQLGRGHDLVQRRATGDPLEDDELEELDAILDRHADRVLEVSPDGLRHEIAQLRALRIQLDAIDIDAKAQRLIEELDRIFADPDMKVLIFTQFKETLVYLERLLGEEFRVATFHGDLDPFDKDRVIDRFRDPFGDQILIATEAAGEGRNLQFCHVMFNYDLPWNPMRVEQRIGRIDRIGQRHPVEIYNFTIENTVEDRVLQRLFERIEIFESTVGNLDPILGNIEREVTQLILRGGDVEQTLVAFEAQLEHRLHEAKAMEERLQDFILDGRSFRRDRTDALLGRRPVFTGADLQEFVHRFLDYHGGRLRTTDPGVVEIDVPAAVRHAVMQTTHRDLRDSYRATFDPELAKANDGLDFIAFGHDLLEGVVAVCLSEANTKTTTLLIETDDLPAGEALCAVVEFSFTGIRPAKQLAAIATSLDGQLLPQLSERFLALLLRAQPASTACPGVSGDLEACAEAVEIEMSELQQRELRRRSADNANAYASERRKFEAYYHSRLTAADLELTRLQAQVRDQSLSPDPNDQRILPATKGRLAIAERRRMDIDHERKHRLAELDRQQVVAAAAELLGVARVRIQPPGGVER